MLSRIINLPRITAVLIFTFAAFTVSGQGISNYNLYNINTYAINPAYVGSGDGLFTLLHFKNHLAGITHAPRNLMFVVHSPVGDNLSLGGNIVVGQGGAFKNTSANIASSYKVNLATDHKLTFGLSGGFVKPGLDMNKLDNTDLSDPTLQAGYNEKVYYKFGLGAIYNWRDLEVSLALPNAKQEEKNLLGKYFIGYASYKFFTADGNWKIQPSLLYKSIPVSPDQADLYVMGEWKKMLWAQAGYRTNNNLIFGGGITIENINVGYAYEAPTGTKELSKGTHEVVFTFLLKKKSAKLSLTENETSVVPHTASDSNYTHIKELEAEVEALKKQVGEISHKISIDSVRHTRDTLYSYDASNKHVSLEQGNYIVVQNCKTHEFADKLIKMYKSKGIETFKVYNETQQVFYIVEKYYTVFEDAEAEMERLKKKGYKNTWVMVY